MPFHYSCLAFAHLFISFFWFYFRDLLIRPSFADSVTSTTQIAEEQQQYQIPAEEMQLWWTSSISQECRHSQTVAARREDQSCGTPDLQSVADVCSWLPRASCLRGALYRPGKPLPPVLFPMNCLIQGLWLEKKNHLPRSLNSWFPFRLLPSHHLRGHRT